LEEVILKKPTRRNFMQQTSAASLSLWTAASAQRILGANDRVRIGFVGVGNRGDQVLNAFVAHPDAQIIFDCRRLSALCPLPPLC
jgi:hypothetical protein